jgi:SMODS and SLOG-associating 2TM effector domain 3/SMODS and SLOG-associating 2TM effector domain 1
MGLPRQAFESDELDAPDIELPAIHSIANDISLKGQRQAKRRIKTQLIALNIAAACSMLIPRSIHSAYAIDWPGVVAIAAFLAVLVVQLDRRIQKPEQAWYDGRAVAESVKTLVWKYSVGSRPFPIGSDDSDILLQRRIQEIILQMKDLNLASHFHEEDEQITPSMRSLRASPLSERKRAYLKNRIKEQHAWYSKKYVSNKKSARKSNGILAMVAITGLLAGLVELATALQVNPLGLLATVAASLFTLLHMNQHETLSRAYGVTSEELAKIAIHSDSQNTEEVWSRFVSEAEEAISREHTLWLASYSTTFDP